MYQRKLYKDADFVKEFSALLSPKGFVYSKGVFGKIYYNEPVACFFAFVQSISDPLKTELELDCCVTIEPICEYNRFGYCEEYFAEGDSLQLRRFRETSVSPLNLRYKISDRKLKCDYIQALAKYVEQSILPELNEGTIESIFRLCNSWGTAIGSQRSTLSEGKRMFALIWQGKYEQAIPIASKLTLNAIEGYQEAITRPDLSKTRQEKERREAFIVLRKNLMDEMHHVQTCLMNNEASELKLIVQAAIKKNLKGLKPWCLEDNIDYDIT